RYQACLYISKTFAVYLMRKTLSWRRGRVVAPSAVALPSFIAFAMILSYKAYSWIVNCLNVNSINCISLPILTLNTHIKAKSYWFILLIYTLFLRGFVLCAIFMLILSLINYIFLSA